MVISTEDTHNTTIMAPKFSFLKAKSQGTGTTQFIDP